MNPAFWAGRPVLLTGHTGFKGGWLSLWLQSLGADLAGYALAPPTRPSLFELAAIGEHMTSTIADIRDGDRLAAALAAHRPEVVFHLAAQPLVRASYADPVGTFATNVMGTVHLLEAVRHTPSVRAVINITSDKCYDNREWVWGYRENDPLGGRDPYSSSKGCAELITRAWRDSYFNPADPAGHGVALASARAGNVIGGGDWAEDRLIPDLLRALAAGRPAIIRHPQAIRPWQHVLEPLSGYLRLAEKLLTAGTAFAEAWNFGPDDRDNRPVQWLADRLTAAWGEGSHWQCDDAPQPHEAHSLRLDCAKARQRLGWTPRWPLTETLARIVAWQRALDAGHDMRAWSLAEIADYQRDSGAG